MNFLTLTDEQRAAMPSWVAYRPECGHLVAAAVDESDPNQLRSIANTVGGWKRSGLHIERITVAEVRAAKWCDCPRPKRKAGQSESPQADNKGERS